MKKLRMLSLCSGIGAIDYVWSFILGQDIAGQVEIDPYCTAVLATHWPTVPRYSDIKEVAADAGRDDTIGAVDIVAGGIPCQPFSSAGKRRGTQDDRYLWPYAFSIVQRFRPTWVLIENVAGFVNLALDLVQTDLESAGYQVQAYVLPACAVGAPHIRERVFIVAYASGLRRKMCTSTERSHSTPDSSDTRVLPDANDCRCWERQDQQKYQLGSNGTSEPGTYGAQGVVANSDASGLSVRNWCPPLGRAPATAYGCPSGQFEPGMGRSLDGAADWLDLTPWPASPGQQEPWEPPRIIAVRRDPTRARRLKALGNAIVPQQIYPLLYSIVALEQEMRAER